jgi:NAD(P)-dependent dehydrogenase (short-subunit alcohol dehydrogenase family)
MSIDHIEAQTEPSLVPQGTGRLVGRVALITGAGTRPDATYPYLGVGGAIALLMASEGAAVGLMDRSGDAIELTRTWLNPPTAECLSLVGDVTSDGDAQRSVAAMVDRFGRLDILVNNVAVVEGGPVDEMTEQVWGRVLDVNLSSAARMSRHAVPRMRLNGGGSIVNVSSIAAIRGAHSAAYAASKGGLVSLTISMAHSHGRGGIRVNAVIPGSIRTPMAAADEFGDELRRQATMLGTDGTGWDVAQATVFLASPAARWITAAALPIDGGATMTSGTSLLRQLGWNSTQ